jgi:cellulose synthase/poly-beta-1,6-N-acetylglucosamine synthase-like glycosyltransferase
VTLPTWLEEAAQAVGTASLVLLGCYLLMTLLLSRRRPASDASDQPPQLVVFVVPARNEELVIRGTVDSLLALEGADLRVLVMDDGSTDGTAAIVETYDDPRLELMCRSAAEAGQGKGAVLNAAYAHIAAMAARGGFDRDGVVVAIVDADGQLPAGALGAVMPLFADPRVGGVQVQVRIRNRRNAWLARCQDYEFLTFSSLVQSAREHLGSVGLGGNGQFTRLAALDSLAPRPWSDCLTEDLDLGLKLTMNGWRNRFTASTFVAQQGLVDVRRVTRQRTRWMQGHLQCWRHIPSLLRSDLPNRTALDLVWYLLAPGVTLLLSVVFGLPLLVFGAGSLVHLLRGGDISLGLGALILYAVSFGPSWLMTLIYRRQTGDLGWWRTAALVHLLAAYNFVLYVATWRAVGRAVTGRRNWTKTDRVQEHHVNLEGAPG